MQIPALLELEASLGELLGADVVSAISAGVASAGLLHRLRRRPTVGVRSRKATGVDDEPDAVMRHAQQMQKLGHCQRFCSFVQTIEQER